METLFIVMPAYNEQENINTVIDRWYKLIDGSTNSLIVVDDSLSTDNTHKILEKLQKSKYPNLKILYSGKKNHGQKLIRLYKYALQNNADFIFQTDSDNQTNPDNFAKFWNNRHKYDAIFGIRHNRENKIRIIGERAVCWLMYYIFNAKVPDANAPFRLINAKTLKACLKFIPPNSCTPNITMVALCELLDKKINFEDIEFKRRSSGKSSLNIFRLSKLWFSCLKELIYIKKSLTIERH